MGKEIKMIKTDKGQIEIEGNIASVIADVGVISNTVRNALVENGMPKEMAEERIIDIVKKRIYERGGNSKSNRGKIRK